MAYANLDQVAHLLMLTPRQVNNLVKEGMPKVARGEYDVVAVVHWYIRKMKAQVDAARRGDETEVQARARLVKATADLREMDLAKQREEVIGLLDVRANLEEVLVATRAKIIGLPRRAAPQLVGRDSPAEIQKFLEELVYEALDELANLPERSVRPRKADASSDTVGLEGVEAPAKVKRKRLGGSVPDVVAGVVGGTG
jgi:phage terminase Nu1 subunit (DNA packaging protein)